MTYRSDIMASDTASDMESFDQQQQKRSDEAIEWLARLRASDVTAAEKADFAAWLAESPLNKAAFDDATRLWHDLNELPLHTELPRKRAFKMHWPLAAAATVVFACVLLLTQFSAVEYDTGHGEQARVVLEDGSIAYLNTNSSISVDYVRGARRVAITRGEVWFDVEPDPARPFTVTGQYASARAVGTAFTVREHADFTRVKVTEGIVALMPQTVALQAASERLTAGEQGTVTPGRSDIDAFAVDTELGWQRGQLIYDDVPLEDLLIDLNRYLPKAMTVNDPALSRTRVSAVLTLDDQDAMLEALRLSLPIRWNTVSDSLIIISPTR